MSITSRINEMSTHIEQAYDELQGLGADLTNVNKNIENISMVLDDIYDSMPQVSGEGTSLTLDDTRVGKIKSTLKGNTSQTGTPTPDTPIPVNVVSGDNEINVVGKNLYIAKNTNSTQGSLTYTVNDNGTFNISGTASSATYFTNDKNINEIGLINGNSYTLSSNKTIPSGVVYKIEIRSATSWLREYLISNSTPTRTFTIDLTDAVTIRYVVQINNGITPNLTNVGVQLEVGTTATTYEPYQGNTYNIDLPVENLLSYPYPQTTKTTNGITFTDLGDGTIKINGTATANAPFTLFASYQSQGTIPGDYVSGGLSSNVRVRVINYSGGNYHVLGSSEGTSVAIDKSTYTQGYIELTVMSGATVNNLIVKPMITNIKANNYTPYGTTPIELCKIGNYQDYFGKSDGRNLCNGINQGVYLNNDVNKCGVTSGDSGLYIPVNGGQYTISTLVTQTRYRVACSNDLPPSVSSAIVYNGQNKDNTSNSITINTTGYNYLIVNATDLSAIQIEKGSSASDYQPYGVGKWYLHKEIGKVAFSDLVFTEIGGNFSQFSTNGNIAMVYLQNDLKVTGNRDDVFCNLLKPYSNSLFGGSQTGINQYYNDTKLLLSVPFANVENFAGVTLTVNNYIDYTKNYIKSLNGNIYYILATPTTTEITYQPLIDQLNLLEKAMSKDGQTNISQVNNDLPFIISASALKEWQESTSLNSTLSMVNPLSLGNTLNTQDNNIQPIEVDNIEPLEEEENEES